MSRLIRFALSLKVDVDLLSRIFGRLLNHGREAAASDYFQSCSSPKGDRNEIPISKILSETIWNQLPLLYYSSFHS